VNWLKALIIQALGLKRRYIGLFCGCFLWILWIIFGFWATLLLFVLAAVGFIAGRVMEEHKNWKELVEKILSERFME
jgi:uncharacterized membrane protein